MKKIGKIITLITFAATLSSCEDFTLGDRFLDKPSSTDQTLDVVYSKELYADQALNEIYNGLRSFICDDNRNGWTIMEQLTDCLAGTGFYTPYHTGSVTSGVKQMYRLPFKEIRSIWIYLENVDRVPDMSTELKERRKNEARVILAYHYTQMLRYYGGMPWVDHAYRVNENIYMERMTVEEHVAKIVELCDMAITGENALPWSVPSTEHGRMTKAAAMALKFKALHFAASPLFNSTEPYLSSATGNDKLTWYGNYDPNRWQVALDAGLEFLKANQEAGETFALVTDPSNPREAFAKGYLDRNNGEIIFPIQNAAKWDRWVQHFSTNRFGAYLPCLEFVNQFELLEGRLPETANVNDVQNPYFTAPDTYIPTRDPRLYETIIVNEDTWQGNTRAQVYNNGLLGPGGATGDFKSLTLNGFGTRKFVRNYQSEIVNKPFCNGYIRLPEIYLNIAECMNELGKTLHRDAFGRNGYDYLNLVRERVGLKKMVSSEAFLEASDRGNAAIAAYLVRESGDEFTDALLHERLVEFAYEECRYFDIVRRKMHHLLNFQRHYIETTLNKNSYNGKYDIKILETKTPFAWCTDWNNKYYLMAIPLSEIQKEYGLVQNPGW